MKNFRRILAAFMLLCMVIPMISPILPVSAAGEVTYVLDTDGIDFGAEYLIVFNPTTTAYALNSATVGMATSLTVTNGTTITNFSSAPDCLWVFESVADGQCYIRHGSSYLKIPSSNNGRPSIQADPVTIKYRDMGSGGYGLYVGSSSFSYLSKVNNNQFRTTRSSSLDRITPLYLFKKEADAKLSVSFDGNHATSGTLPATITNLDKNDTITVPAPTDLIKVEGDDTYLFWCWTENQDGTGMEYRPGMDLTVTNNMTLYAQWYLQIRHTVKVITDLNDTPTDIEDIASKPVDVTLYIKLEQESSPLIPLTRTEQGVYTTTVTENGTYFVYYQEGDEEPVEAHGHKVVIFNQDGVTELLNYSVSYDANGGAFAEEPATVNYHANTRVTAIEQIPVREGYRFLGWKANDALIAPGGVVTEALLEKTVLTAQWEELTTVTVQITMVHYDEDGHINTAEDRENLDILLVQDVDGFAQPYGEAQHLDKNHSSYRPDEKDENISYYTLTFDNLPQALYSIGCEKSHYAAAFINPIPEEGQVIALMLVYTPDNFDLNFQVNVQKDNLPENLCPTSVNVRVTYWEDGKWQDIDQQAGATPITVFLDENGTGTGFLPVPKVIGDVPAYYRVRVSSFIMPDGTVVPAENAQTDVTYTPEGSGLYTATVTVPDGQKPENANLEGAYKDTHNQVGVPTVDITIHPFTVTFDAGEGKLDKQDSLILENQYMYPDLQKYIPVHVQDHYTFDGWYVDGNKAENLAGKYLTENITYVAQYKPTFSISGTVTAGFSYEYNGQPVTMHESDRIKTVRVVLQKNINGVYNDVDSRLVDITYNADQGSGSYTFDNLPNDDTQYSIHVLLHNYTVSYDNNADTSYSPDEFPVTQVNRVDVALQPSPESYVQEFIVDTSLISEGFRPDSALVEILYRDLGDTLPYNVISQHTVDPYGLLTPIAQNGIGTGSEQIWKWHNDGALYEYQLNVTKLYGQVGNSYAPEGIAYDYNMPFTIRYDLPSYYMTGTSDQMALLATLVPKEYRVIFDMGLDDELGHVQGMDEFHVDTMDTDHYAYYHTWSTISHISAYPYREGYVFTGWEIKDESQKNTITIINGGMVHIGAELSTDVRLVATWTPLEGTDYTIRHLELNTNKVLKGATVVSGAETGSSVKAVEAADAPITGYVYAGAMINGVYYDKDKNPELIVSDDPTKNLMVLYYLPDGSDGYTDQVESNLHLDKQATLEDNGTYTIQMETFTKDNPITTRIQQNTPLDIVLVLDQSASMAGSYFVENTPMYKLRNAVDQFATLIANHGRTNKVDHRMAIVGYASNGTSGGFSNSYTYPTVGKDGNSWHNTGVFDSNGDFHVYNVTGFDYTLYTGEISITGTYYTKVDNEFLLLTYHTEYWHLINETDARKELLNDTPIYGYADGQFVELTRNSSGLWLYGDKKLYSQPEFFTYHTNVWTHRKGTESRQIHGYMINGKFQSADGHTGVYTRAESRDAAPDKSIYEDALVPVSLGADGSGNVTPGLHKAAQAIGGNGKTYITNGIEMANRIFAANPVDPAEGRIRIMIVFTDGMPGDGSAFDMDEANNALKLASVTSNTHGAYIYTIGLYGSDVLSTDNEQTYFLSGLSSNYPNATDMSQVWTGEKYVPALEDLNTNFIGDPKLNIDGPYFVYDEADGAYYQLAYHVEHMGGTTYDYRWQYTNNAGETTVIWNTNVSGSHPMIVDNKVNDYAIYRRTGAGYIDTPNSGYYKAAETPDDLLEYFSETVQTITTKITTEIILHEDTIVRDIMGQGLVLTPNTVITAYRQAGTYDPDTETVKWHGDYEELASVTIPAEAPANGILHSQNTTTIKQTASDGTVTGEKTVPYISVYNLNAENPTNPDEANYHPHTVDITGYKFHDWYLREDHLEGYKMVVTITNIEARDDVQWGRATTTNHEQSGLWLPMDASGNRELLLPFDQPTTIFVERAYVLDYGKEFELTGWYFDDDGEQKASAIHLDCDVTNGMNKFDEKNPVKANGGSTGNTKYGNVRIDGDKVTYTPVTTQWGGYDQFYVFGNTWRKTVLSQDANLNGDGNLWNKVTVIPANNVYYEDSFLTEESDGANKFSGFEFTGNWTVVYTDDNPANAGQNKENPEHQEDPPYGAVHGWTDSLGDDQKYSDGSAHMAGGKDENGKNTMGAKATFRFTGTGVDVYTRTNQSTGLIVATLTRVDEGATPLTRSLAMDNLSMSGDYYQIPTLSFTQLPYGTYEVTVIATAASDVATGSKRFEYYLDGIRVYNPLGDVFNSASDVVKDAYNKELSPVFTEIRDIMLKYDDFNHGIADNGQMGAVFIDWIKPGQESGNDQPGIDTTTYEVGTTFNTYGPKNEVYLTQGQAVVLKVDPDNTYFVGMKTITPGKTAQVNVSGLMMSGATTIPVGHTTDMYYEVTPMDGYIVIQNASTDGALLALTKLRTTNIYATTTSSGVLDVKSTEAVELMYIFEEALLNQSADSPTSETPPNTEDYAERNKKLAQNLFNNVRTWLQSA